MDATDRTIYGWALAALVALAVLTWVYGPADEPPAADPAAAVADSTLSAEATRAQLDAARAIADADSLAAVTAELSDQNAALAADLDRLTRRNDALFTSTARSVHALPPDSLARLADRTLVQRLAGR